MSDPVGEPARTCGDSGGITKAGQPCRVSMNLSATTGRCVQHDPERLEAARQLQALGGTAAGEAKRREKAALPEGVPKAPKTIADAERFASWLTRAVCVGDLDAKVGQVAATCLKEFRGASEKRILEAQVKGLRAELAEAKRARTR